MTQDRYTHGHHTSVVDAHATRTIDNSAKYLERHLVPGRSLLDAGCGPGTITAEFAARLGPTSRVVGFDLSTEVVHRATASFPDSTAEFATMDLYDLDIADDSFDIAHAHQVLQHVSDPVTALRELRRVVRPGGIVAVRDADYAAMHWAPESPALDRWQHVYREVAYANHAEPDAGRHLVRWAREAGFTDVTPTVSTWLFSRPDERSWWGGTWSQRIVASSLAEQAVEGGFATIDELNQLSQGWKQWIEETDGWFVVVHGELVCTVD